MNLSQSSPKVNTYVPNLPGVYIIGSNALKKCVYVGRTRNIRRRLRQHFKGKSTESWLINLLRPDCFKFVVLRSHEDRVFAEALLKMRLDPLYDQIRREIKEALN